jgi:Tol biopolymer transport system component
LRRLGGLATGAVGWSPDGRRFALIASSRGGERTWIDIVDRDGRHPRRATPHGAYDCYAGEWSPDSRKLALSRVQGCEGDTAVYVVDRDGTHLRRLTGVSKRAPDISLYGLDAAWSPDGQWLAFLGGFTRAKLFVMRSDGSGARPLGRISPWDNGLPGHPPAWSPDGRYLFALDSANSVMRIDRNGSHPRVVSAAGLHVESFRLASNGRRILLRAAPHGKPWNVYAVNSNGSGWRDLSPPKLYVGGYAVSPDGTRVTFGAGRGNTGPSSIYVVDSDGSHLKQLTNHANDACPNWSPDGEHIAFMHDRSQIEVMNADGGHLHTISGNRMHDGCPSWAPSLATR